MVHLNEDRGKGETAVPVPARDPEGRASFRMKYFRPVWRYKTRGRRWTRWSPFSGEPFISADPKTITDFEVSAEIVVRKGPMDDADPLAFEARAVVRPARQPGLAAEVRKESVMIKRAWRLPASR